MYNKIHNSVEIVKLYINKDFIASIPCLLWFMMNELYQDLLKITPWCFLVPVLNEKFLFLV